MLGYTTARAEGAKWSLDDVRKSHPKEASITVTSEVFVLIASPCIAIAVPISVQRALNRVGSSVVARDVLDDGDSLR